MLVAILGGGPSMNQEVATAVMGSKAFVIAINNVFLLAPFADALFACDPDWWFAHPEAAEFRGERLVCDDMRSQRKVPYATHVSPKNLGSGSNSALQAAHWAIDRGATKVALFGVDLCDNELTHWHGLHETLPNPTVGTFQRARKAWAEFAKLGVETVNCSIRSALTCFPKVSMESALG